jgi:hypothetical protein
MFALGKSWLLFAICFTQISKLLFVFNVSCELQPTFLFYVNSLLFMLSIIVVHVCVFTQLFFFLCTWTCLVSAMKNLRFCFCDFHDFVYIFLLYTFDVVVDVDFLLGLSSLNTTTNNITNFFVLYNHPIFNYMWLFDICNNVLLFLQLFTIFLNVLLFLWLWCNYKITHMSILINLLDFLFKNRPLCSFNHKISYNLVISYSVFIYTLRKYI